MNRRRGLLLLAILLHLPTGTAFSEETSSSGYFPGGDSPILSTDVDRAEQAIRRWTRPEEWMRGDPREDPYHWDFQKVGRHVFLRIHKNGNEAGRLECWLKEPEKDTYELFKTYRIAYFSGNLGPKTRQGDNQAPEGFYHISRARMNPASSYHLSMDIGYPNGFDRALGRTGSLIMIHGKAVSVGCFAMTDASIEQIYTLVDAALKSGQPFVRVHCLGLFHFCSAIRRVRCGIPAVLRAVAGSLATGPVPPGTPILREIERFRHRVPARGNPVASAVLTALPGASLLGRITVALPLLITYFLSMP